MDRPLHPVSASKPGRKPWPLRGLIAAIAVLPLLALMALTPISWWKASGFTSYPGTFVRVGQSDYWLCRPWANASPRNFGVAGANVTARFGTITGAGQSNFAVLLPRTARITAIFCGDAPASWPLGECSGRHCAVPAQFQIDDGVYTKGRGVMFSVRARAAKPDQRTDVGFWVIWRPE
jgi:hypothetical protein